MMVCSSADSLISCRYLDQTYLTGTVPSELGSLSAIQWVYVFFCLKCDFAVFLLFLIFG